MIILETVLKPLTIGRRSMTNTDSPLGEDNRIEDPIRAVFNKIALNEVERYKYVQELELYCHKQVIEARKEGYDHNLLGSWIFIGDNARLNNLDDLYWSYVQEFVAKDNPYRKEPYEKMEYIKKTMPYASFSKVGIFKLLARADQNAKERIAKLRKTL